MRRLGIAFLPLVLASNASAADVGLGFSVGYWSHSIVVPVKLDNGMTLEGSIGYSDFRSDESDRMSFKSKGYDLGVGVYWRKRLSTSSEYYLGPQVSYSRGSFETVSGKSRSNGWSVAPTFGIEYSPVKKISFGGEIGLNYSNGKSKYDDPNLLVSGESRQRGYGTFSNWFVRMYF